MQPVSKQRIGKHALTTIVIVINGVFYSVREKWLQRREIGQQFQLSRLSVAMFHSRNYNVTFN
jgi:hypothetical protein